jgi:DNA-binding MarR family transcriptional regulator
LSNDKSELLEQLIRLEWLLRYRHMRTHREHGPMGDPHRGQGRILAVLKLKPEVGQKELSAILDIRSQSLGELLAKLERQGYITRTPSAADHRAMDIRLTEAGKAAADQPDDSPNADSLFGSLTEKEQVTLSDYLGRLIQAWEAELSTEAPGAGGMGFGRRRGFPGLRPFPNGDWRRPPFGARGFGPPSPDKDKP